MSQPKKRSIEEAVMNTVVGFVIAYMVNYLVLNGLDMPATPKKTLMITVLFTIISVVRSYTIRRWFNRRE